MTNEPVRLISLINAAIVGTLAILLFAGVDPDLVGAITIAVLAWVAVIGEVVRARVGSPATLERLEHDNP